MPAEDRRSAGRKHKRQHPFYDSQAWKVLRRQIVSRDGYRCTVCHVPLTSSRARVDHIVRMKDAPHLALEPSNLRTLCGRCDGQSHRERGTGTSYRIERFVLGHDEHGMPRDEQHHWHDATNVNPTHARE